MISREVFYPIARRAFWGYFLLLLDLNLTLNSALCLPLLPNVLGWYLILQAARAGAEYRPTMKLLFPFCTALALYSLLQFLPAIGAMVPALVGLLVAVVTLYTHFQFFTDLAALAEDALPGEAAAGSLLRGRTVLVVSNTAVYAAGLLSDVEHFPPRDKAEEPIVPFLYPEALPAAGDLGKVKIIGYGNLHAPFLSFLWWFAVRPAGSNPGRF